MGPLGCAVVEVCALNISLLKIVFPSLVYVYPTRTPNEASEAFY